MGYKVSETRDSRQRRQMAAVNFKQTASFQNLHTGMRETNYAPAQCVYNFVRIRFHKIFAERYTCRVDMRHFKMCPNKWRS